MQWHGFKIMHQGIQFILDNNFTCILNRCVDVWRKKTCLPDAGCVGNGTVGRIKQTKNRSFVAFAVPSLGFQGLAVGL